MINQHSKLQTPNSTITIRPALPADFPAIFSLFQLILHEGSTYSYAPEEMHEARARYYWLEAENTHCYIAEIDGVFAGCYALRPNRTGRASHVANDSFMIHPAHRGQGVGRALGEHLLKEAALRGFQAIQHNFVVSTNIAAVNLWKSLGFAIIGTMPKGFLHASKGLVDVHIMHRFL